MAATHGGRSGEGVVVLGGTAGIGWEAAAQFAARGDRVVLLGRNAERGAQACGALTARVGHADVHFVPVDAGDPAAAERAAADATERLGSVEVLVCASGSGSLPALLHTLPTAQVAGILSELVLPPLHLCQAMLPGMRAAGRGSVVLVASDAAKVPTPGEAVIGAAMAAITMFGRTAALEAKREGVRINVLTPSLVANTPGAARIDTDAFAARLFAKATKLAQLGVAEPADVAAMAVFLCSPAAARVTGQVISVNGGISVG